MTDTAALAPRSSAADRQAADGFTLIELLVVMVIIGVLAAIAIPVFLSSRDRAHDTDARATGRLAVQAVTEQLIDGGPTTDANVMRAIAPSLTWQSSNGVNDNNNPATPDKAVVFESANGLANAMVLVVRSASGRCFYARVVNDTAPSTGAGYLATAGPCRDPWDVTGAMTNPSW